MRKHNFFYIVLLTIAFFYFIWRIKNELPRNRLSSAVTYKLDCGRFGDQLLNYIKALWISWKYSLPLLYRPFAYSDQLELSKIHTSIFNNLVLKNYKTLIEFDNKTEASEIIKQLDKNQNDILYLISFYAPMWEWEDEEFRKKLSELIRPIKFIETLKLPQDRITVAVHVRSRNNSYDLQSVIDNMPTKFPPHSFYINGLKHISNYFKNEPLFVYIFTDDPKPILIRDLYLKELKGDIEIECRVSENNHDINVLEDFFSMIKFDCLIRPHSSFSGSVAAISGPLVEIIPSEWSNKISVIDSLVKIRSAKGKKLIGQYVVKSEL